MTTEPLVEYVEEVGGLYFRSLLLPQAGMRIPQHLHPYDHVTYCGSGSAIVFADGKAIDVIAAGRAVEVRANIAHEFESIEENTRLTCIHDTRSAQFIKESGV
jgi:quercetin dioxygenase-like cupin family protein